MLERLSARDVIVRWHLVEVHRPGSSVDGSTFSASLLGHVISDPGCWGGWRRGITETLGLFFKTSVSAFRINGLEGTKRFFG